MLNVSYASVVRSIMYIMVYIHPEISHVVSVVNRFMINHGKVHKHAMKWILCYLKGTTDIGLIYNRSSGTRSNVKGFVDSDYTSSLDRRKSLTGYVFTILECVISWKEISQSIFSLSTIEVEHMTLTKGVEETLWLRGLVCNLCLSHELIIVHYNE
jgi:hypothetical protein